MKKKNKKRGNGRKAPVQPCSKFKVDQLSAKAQAAVFRGYARGDSFRTIREAVLALGESVSKMALSRYRHKAWSEERNRLKRARGTVETMKEALQLNPESPPARIAEEMLYTGVCAKLAEREDAAVLRWLREAREQKKLRGKKDEPAPDSKPLSEEEINRRIREIYGLPPERGDDEED
jgi:hypothetical protein